MRKFFITATIVAMSLSALATDEVVRRGDPVSDKKPVAIADVLASPEAYEKDVVVIEGVIEASCVNKGCWMTLAAAKGEPGMRVTFKDYGFFIPLDAKGWSARAEGVAKIQTLSKAEAEHLESEGAKLSRAEDGTAREISFVASGVELRK